MSMKETERNVPKGERGATSLTEIFNKIKDGVNRVKPRAAKEFILVPVLVGMLGIPGTSPCATPGDSLAKPERDSLAKPERIRSWSDVEEDIIVMPLVTEELIRSTIKEFEERMNRHFKNFFFDFGYARGSKFATRWAIYEEDLPYELEDSTFIRQELVTMERVDKIFTEVITEEGFVVLKKEPEKNKVHYIIEKEGKKYDLSVYVSDYLVTEEYLENPYEGPETQEEIMEHPEGYDGNIFLGRLVTAIIKLIKSNN